MSVESMQRRGSGLLLHVTSLPSGHGVGDLGPEAYRFADFLAESGQRFWQVLPLNPTDPAHGNSPYSSESAFACYPLLISPELLLEEGLLAPEDLEPAQDFPDARVDYETAGAFKGRLFARARERFRARGADASYEAFCRENGYWLDDHALFVALKERHDGLPWNEWPGPLRDREEEALRSAREALHDRVEDERILQFLFHRQWVRLRQYCNERGIQIFGDLPIYVNLDSADVWTHPGLFKLDASMRPTLVAGVPPDYFSETGQRWGNPVYRWDVLQSSGYDWWIQRLERNLRLFDIVRIDHFRGFAACWEIPANEPTAIHGQWVAVPGDDFFQRVREHFHELPIVAEDLGLITDDVRELMARFELPGMKLLIFAFGPDLPTNPYAPHNHVQNCIIYTGTHDNNTTRGWFTKELADEDRARMAAYLGRELTAENIHEEMVRLAMVSVANTAILPVQDLLGLGEEDRMNLPATGTGNWEWRLRPGQLNPDLAHSLRAMTERYGRC